MQIDFSNNSNRSLDLYPSNNNKYQQNVRQQSTNMDRSSLLNRYSNLPNSSLNGTKYNPHLISNNDQRLFSSNMGMNSMHPMHMMLANNTHNNNNNNTNQLLESPSMIHKSIDPDLLISKNEMQLIYGNVVFSEWSQLNDYIHLSGHHFLIHVNLRINLAV